MPDNSFNQNPLLGARYIQALALMRYLSIVLILACSACDPSREDLLAEAKRAQQEILLRAEAKHSLQAFGGTVSGKNMGEWGGEVAFREPDGISYQLIPDNSQGIFNMSYGVIAVTGLAHLGDNHGAVYQLSRESGKRVTATATLRLPGWPCDVTATDDEVLMRVFNGYTSGPDTSVEPKYDCYALQSPRQIRPMSCPPTIPDGCFQ